MVKSLADLASIAMLRADADAAENQDLPSFVRDILKEMDAKLVIKGEADPAKIKKYCQQLSKVLTKRTASWEARLKEAKAVAGKLKGKLDDDPELPELQKTRQALISKAEKSIRKYAGFYKEVEAAQKELNKTLKKNPLKGMEKLIELNIVWKQTYDLMALIKQVAAVWGRLL